MAETFSQLFPYRFQHIHHRYLGSDIVFAGNADLRHVVREVKVRHARQRRGFAIGNADDLTVMQAKLAGQFKNFRRFSGNR
ncbi:hypothetical protein D3C75_678020 [compost metagenome]